MFQKKGSEMRNFLIFFLLFSFFYHLNSQTISKDNLIIDMKKEIVFGQSGSFSGHFAFYGNTIKNAINSYFEHINQQGGIAGKKLRLISLDDEGEADKTKNNIELLYHKYAVSMFFGVMGTRGILSVLPLIQQQKIAMLFPWGGHPELKNPSLSHIINGPGLLEPQVETLADHIVKTLSLTKIAIFHADDDFSTAATHVLAKALESLNQKPVAIEQYNRYTIDIHTPAQKLLAQDPRVVICVATSTPTIKLINYFFEQGSFTTKFFGIDSTFLAQDILQHKGVAFHVASPVPDPVTSTFQLATEYHRDITNYFPDEDFSILSFTYYIAAQLIVDALNKTAPDCSQEALLKELSNIKNKDFKGLSIDFDPTNRHLFGKKIWII